MQKPADDEVCNALLCSTSAGSADFIAFAAFMREFASEPHEEIAVFLHPESLCTSTDGNCFCPARACAHQQHGCSGQQKLSFPQSGHSSPVMGRVLCLLTGLHGSCGFDTLPLTWSASAWLFHCKHQSAPVVMQRHRSQKMTCSVKPPIGALAKLISC